jgi:hypothetical protein
MSCHRVFLKDWHLNERAISSRIAGNWLVRCGHCGLSLGGLQGNEGPITDVTWRHDGKTFFGEFYVA